MREYINIYQLDDIGNDKVRFDDYLAVSQNALTYKFRVGELRDFVIDGIDTTLPIYNANQLMSYAIEFTKPLSNYQLLTFDETDNAWVNRELDIDAVFRSNDYEPDKFLRLNTQKEVITSDVYVSDLVVDTPNQADHFLAVHDNGSDVIYVDVYSYIDNEIKTRSDTFIPLLNDEIARATNEEQRLETLINNEITRATNEEVRIETKFDTLLQDEIDRATNEEQRLENLINNNVQNAIDSNTTEIQRVETDLRQMIEDETDRAVDEERRLENLLRGVTDAISNLGPSLFPIGSVIMRPNDPGLSMSNGGVGFGVWEKIEGMSLIGTGSHTDSNGASMNFMEQDTYGTFEHRLTENEMPNHNHSASTGSDGSHSHNASADNGGSHSHTGSTQNAGSHTHNGSADSGGSHSHSMTFHAGSEASGGVVDLDGFLIINKDTDMGYKTNSGVINSDGSHSHNVSIYSGGSHSHTVNIDSGGSHSHSVSVSSAGTHTHSVSVNSTGGNQPHNNLHPVFAVPMWLRTA